MFNLPIYYHSSIKHDRPVIRTFPSCRGYCRRQRRHRSNDLFFRLREPSHNCTVVSFSLKKPSHVYFFRLVVLRPRYHTSTTCVTCTIQAELGLLRTVASGVWHLLWAEQGPSYTEPEVAFLLESAIGTEDVETETTMAYTGMDI